VAQLVADNSPRLKRTSQIGSPRQSDREVAHAVAQPMLQLGTFGARGPRSAVRVHVLCVPAAPARCLWRREPRRASWIPDEMTVVRVTTPRTGINRTMSAWTAHNGCDTRMQPIAVRVPDTWEGRRDLVLAGGSESQGSLIDRLPRPRRKCPC
jgi:hypothetical protein